MIGVACHSRGFGMGRKKLAACLRLTQEIKEKNPTVDYRFFSVSFVSFTLIYALFLYMILLLFFMNHTYL
jgi:hypothetical protein